MTKPDLSRDEDLDRYRARRQVFALQAGANLKILFGEDGEVAADAIPDGHGLIAAAEAREFEAWMLEIIGWGFTSVEHRERAAALRTRAPQLEWDPRQEALEVAKDHELAAQLRDGKL